jgi:hypothetical protein
MDSEKAKVLDTLVYVKKTMPSVLYREEILDGEPVAVLYDAVNKEMYHLKGNSSHIWRLIDGRRSVRDIACALADQAPDADPALILKDTVQFITKIGRQGLISYAYKMEASAPGELCDA